MVGDGIVRSLSGGPVAVLSARACGGSWMTFSQSATSGTLSLYLYFSSHEDMKSKSKVRKAKHHQSEPLFHQTIPYAPPPCIAYVNSSHIDYSVTTVPPPSAALSMLAKHSSSSYYPIYSLPPSLPSRTAMRSSITGNPPTT